MKLKCSLPYSQDFFPMASVLSQTNPVYTLPFYAVQYYPHKYVLVTQLSLSLRLRYQNFICIKLLFLYLCGLVVRVPGYRSRSPGSISRRYQIFWEVVGLERGPLSLVSKIEELLGWNSSGSGLESREYGRRDPSRWPRAPSIRKSWQ
jgi:hypothetical protein